MPMSILEQVLTDALASVLRKPPAETPRRRVAEDRHGDHPGKRVGHPSQSGAKVVILNWKAGENDPFTVVNGTIRQHFHACGKNVEVIEITEPDWPDRVAELVA